MKFEAKFRTGMSILHIAPEKGMSDFFLSLPEVDYQPVDLFPQLYRHTKVKRIDLVSDAEKLPSETFDIIFHAHVMEHIPSNVYSILLHLHRSLKADGLHIFTIPIYAGEYEECLGDIGEDQRDLRFHQKDHVRRFGRNDIQMTIGKIFNIPKEYQLSTKYPDIDLVAINVHEDAGFGYSSNAVFCLRKEDCVFDGKYEFDGILAELELAKQRIVNLEKRSQALVSYVEELRSSTSWRTTAPLRFVKNMISRTLLRK